MYSRGLPRRTHLKHQLSVGDPSLISQNAGWVPNTDIYETEHELIIKMEIPGITKDDIEISLEDRTIRIIGERRDSCRGEKCCYRQLEIEYGQFERQILLPRTVDTNGIKANYHNGFLHVALPKRAHSEQDTIAVIIESD